MSFLGRIKHSTVRKAHENGSKIEMQLDKGEWVHWKNPTWCWGVKYRIKK
jgi:hypothetical protein